MYFDDRYLQVNYPSLQKGAYVIYSNADDPNSECRKSHNGDYDTGIDQQKQLNAGCYVSDPGNHEQHNCYGQDDYYNEFELFNESLQFCHDYYPLSIF